MDRIVEIGFRNPPRGAVGDWFVRIKDGARPADYVEFRDQIQAQRYAAELDEFADFDLVDG